MSFKLRMWTFMVCVSLAEVCVCAEPEADTPCISVTPFVDNNSSTLVSPPDAELLIAPRQASALKKIELEISLRNTGQTNCSFRADSFLDGITFVVKQKADNSLALPENQRLRVDARVLPPRPYKIKSIRLETKAKDGTLQAVDMYAPLIDCNDPHVLRASAVQIPSGARLVLAIVIDTLVKTDENDKIQSVNVLPGEYSLDVSMLAYFDKSDSNKGYFRYKLVSPASLTVE